MSGMANRDGMMRRDQSRMGAVRRWRLPLAGAMAMDLAGIVHRETGKGPIDVSWLDELTGW